MKKLLFLLIITTFFCETRMTFSQTNAPIIDDKTRKIEVLGSAEMKVVPDEIYVTFTLQEYYNKQKVKIDIDKIQKDFLEKCSKAGIMKERIQIQNMNGFDPNSWYWRKKRTPDMMASTSYVIKFSLASDIDKLVNTLDENATQNMNISHTTHSNIEEFRKEIKIKALQAAKVKAQYLCESIGEKVGKTLYIEEIDNENPRPMYKANMSFGEVNTTANEGIDFEKITIRYTMLARFEIQ